MNIFNNNLLQMQVNLVKMSDVRNKLLQLVLLLISSRYCGNSNALDNNGFYKLRRFLMSLEEISELAEEISEITADGGMEKYRVGLDNEDVNLNISQLIKKYSHHPSEEHHVQTSDGYILTLFRILGKGSPVFVMHGLRSSADDWVTVESKSALPYLLAEQGYDVWLGNARGNKHSRKHKHLSPDSKEFWDFSWDEIGRYDLPASIDYVLNVTGQQQLKYVGHSQGTTAFFVMCSERPEYNHKISLMVALSAVAWMSHIRSPLIRLLVPLSPLADSVLSVFGEYELSPSVTLTRLLTRGLCGNNELADVVCSNMIFLNSGFDDEHLNVTNIPVVFNHMPSSVSKNQLLHYAQEIKSGKFRRYDYGLIKNYAVYGSLDPPDYPVEKVTAPVAIFYSTWDWLSNITDVKILVGKLKNVVDYYEVPAHKFSHIDYLWANNVKELVYSRLLKLFKKN